MSKRAEEAALKAYPEMDIYRAANPHKTQLRKERRRCYKQGYEQAEKDLALTIADIEHIHVFLYAVKNNKQGAFTFQKLKDEQYQEVLDRFNEAKEDEK